MSIADVTGLAEGFLTVYFIWRQNEILKRANVLLAQQNEIVAKQEGKRKMEPSDVKPNSTIKRYWPMLAMTCLALLTWTGIGVAYYYRHFAVSTISTSVRMAPKQFTTFDGKASDIRKLEPNKPVAMNLGVANYGPLPALNVGITAQIKWPSLMSKSEEQDAWDDFIKNHPIPGLIDLDVADGSWTTYQTSPLSSDDIKEIANGKKVMYLFIHYEYRDNGGHHSTDRCQYLQTPVKEADVWVNCKNPEYNRIR